MNIDQDIKQKLAEDYYISKVKDITSNPYYFHESPVLQSVESSLIHDSVLIISRIAQSNRHSFYAIYSSLLSILLKKYALSDTHLIGLGLPAYSGDQNSSVFLKVSSKSDDLVKKVFENSAADLTESLNFGETDLVKLSDRLQRHNIDQRILFEYRLIYGDDICSEQDPAGLKLHIKNVGSNQLQIKLTYIEGKFSSELIKQFLKHFIHLIKILPESLNHQIGKLEILPPHDKSSILKLSYNKNIGGADTPEFFFARFDKMARENSEEVALETEKEKYTYRQLELQVAKAAFVLSNQMEVSKGDIVAVISERSAETVITILALIRIGAAFLPLDKVNPVERINSILENSKPKLVLTENESLTSGLKHNVRELGHFMKLVSDSGILNPTEATNSDELAYIIYTSGTTGHPKGVKINQENLANYLSWASTYYFNGGKANMPLFTSLASDLTVTSLLLPFFTGGKLLICSLDLVSALRHAFSQEGNCNAVKLTPSHIILLADLEIEKTSVGKVICGGENLTTKHVYCLKKMNPEMEVYNEYGPTETTVGCSVFRVELEESFESIPIGRPISNTHIYILDNDLNPVPFGVKGEIYISGKSVSVGYHNRQDLTDEKFLVDPFNSGFIMYKTGDHGYYRVDNNIIYAGRNDDQVKINGNRIELGEIESKLEKFPGIIEACIILSKGETENTELIAFVSGLSQEELPKLDLYLKTVLPAYMLPSRTIILNTFPVTFNGKIDKKALLSEIENRSEVLSQPRTEIESQLRDIWLQLLNKPVGVNDNFFAIGGNSLLAIRLTVLIEKKLSLKFGLRDVFANQILSDMALALQQCKRSQYLSIPILEPAETYELSRAQKRLWILSQTEEGTRYYTMTRAFMLEGQVISENLEEALRLLIVRHESLRTVFSTDSGVTKQRILKENEFSFSLNVIENNDEPTYEVIQEKVENESQKLFDLERQIPIRVSIINIKEKQAILVLNIHHIQCDGWSIEVIVRDLLSLYESVCKNKVPELQPLKVQYKDYSSWHDKVISGNNLKLHKEFWKKKFEGDIPVLELPLDFIRPALKTYKGNTVSYSLDKGTYYQLNELAVSCNATLYTTVLSVINIFLYKLTGQNDIIIGTPASGRDHNDLLDQVGFFINMLASRTVFSPRITTKELVTKVHSETMEILNHQIYPFDMLLEDVKFRRDPGRSAVYNIGYNWDEYGGKELKNQFVSLNPIDTGLKKAQNDLWFFAGKNSDMIDITLEYNTDLFKEQTAIKFLKKFDVVLRECVGSPAKSIESINDNPFTEKEIGSRNVDIQINF